MDETRLSYKEQVLKLGNGKMLEPGYYDANMHLVSKFEKTKIRGETTYQKLKHKYLKDVHYVICPEDLVSIPSYMFEYMLYLETVILPDCLETIGIFCFQNDISLKTIQLPTSLKCISGYCFSHSGLTSIEIPSSVTEIYNSVFEDCYKLKSFSMPKADGNVDFLNDLFCNCIRLEDVTLPEGKVITLFLLQ